MASAAIRGLVDSESLLRVRAAILLTALVAGLSFATGVLNVGAETVSGPLRDVVPVAVQRTAGFTGTLTGFLMLSSAYGLRRGYRLAWYSSVVLMPVTALQGLLQSSVFSLPLVVLSLLSLPTLLINRGVFAREVDLSTGQLASLSALVGALVYGTVGSYALRDEFGGNLDTLLDAFYFAVVTASTVGFGDVTPTPEAPVARLFAVSYVVLGTASFAVALGSLLGPAIEARLSRALGTMNDADIDLLDGHIVVVGYGDLTEPILEELEEAGEPFVVVTRDADRAAGLRGRDLEVLVGDPSDEEPLRRAGIERARALVAATNDDAQDAMAILTARELNPDLHIVAAATDRENSKKLRRAGADTVLSPAQLGGHLLVRSALGQTGMEDVAARLLEDEPVADVDAADDADPPG